MVCRDSLAGSTEVSGDVTCMELKAPQISTQTTVWEQHGIPIGNLRSKGVVGGDKTALMLLRAANDPVESEHQDSTHSIWPNSALNDSVTPAETSGQSFSGLLYVTGPLVALGYLSDGQDDTENSAFVDGEPPWSEPKDGGRSEGRWACTGDICSVIGGNLYFVGRKDHMVKIHGQRVYLEAVERAVAAALAVRHDKEADECYSQVIALAVTLEAVKYALHRQQIVVFLVLDSTTNNEARMASYPQKRGLYTWIAEHYGASHVPSDVLLVGRDAVQRLTHGKMDRRGLEALYVRHISHIKDDGQGLETASSPENGSDSSLLEEVVRLLSNILDVSSSAGRSEDIRRCTFTELGGNSLLATLFVYELHTAGFDTSQLTTQALVSQLLVRAI
ncbi:hypothetical protein BBJ28_00001727 [Nothophytophthora sp. Chile5]|nr:hypothetical protein BBJ28_00001727 [Nothophytophthora sp. Chile5]